MLFQTNFLQILQIVIPDVWQSMQTVFVFSGQFVVQILQKTFGPFYLIVLPDNSFKLLQVTVSDFFAIFLSQSISYANCDNSFTLSCSRSCFTNYRYRHLFQIVTNCFFCNQLFQIICCTFSNYLLGQLSCTLFLKPLFCKLSFQTFFANFKMRSRFFLTKFAYCCLGSFFAR